MDSNGNVYVVDDHPMVRSALTALLNAAGYHVTAFERAERFLLDADVRSPAVVLTDLRMPTMTGLELLKRIMLRSDCPPIIVMSGESAPQEIIEAFKEGAVDFLLKPVSNNQLLASINKALDLDAERARKRADAARLKLVVSSLTGREKEVLTMICKGLGNKAIAAKLQVRADTVKKYRAQVYAKFNVSDLAEMLAIVNAHGAELVNLASQETRRSLD